MLIPLLIWLLVFAVVLYVAYYILGQLPLPAPVKQVVLIVFGLLALIVLIEHFAGFLGATSLR